MNKQDYRILIISLVLVLLTLIISLLEQEIILRKERLVSTKLDDIERYYNLTGKNWTFYEGYFYYNKSIENEGRKQ